MKFTEGGVHEVGYLVVAKVSNAPFVGVVDVLVGCEISGFYFQSHLFIGFAERCACYYAAVHFFNGENRVVERIFENVFVNFGTFHDICGHSYAVEQFPESRHEHFFYCLQVSRISANEVVHNSRDLRGQSLELVAFCTDKLENIRVLFVRHYARACCTFRREMNETEVLRIKHACVERQLGYGARNACYGKGNGALRLSATHLGINHIVVHGFETQ